MDVVVNAHFSKINKQKKERKKKKKKNLWLYAIKNQTCEFSRHLEKSNSQYLNKSC